MVLKHHKRHWQRESYRVIRLPEWCFGGAMDNRRSAPGSQAVHVDYKNYKKTVCLFVWKC